MADALTPVLTDADVSKLADCEEMWGDQLVSLVRATEAAVLTKLAAQAPAQPDRAVMQQALDALQTLHSMQSEWHADFPEHVGDKEAPAMQAARAAIAALSATMEKPHG